MKFINLTPHTINLNSGVSYEPSGIVVRVESSHSEFDENGIADMLFGDVYATSGETLVDIPEVVEGTIYIVSMVCLDAIKIQLGRTDFVAPASGHKEVVRNDKGHIVSVPGLRR